MMCVKLGEVMQICEFVCDFFYSRHLVVIVMDSSVEVTWI